MNIRQSMEGVVEHVTVLDQLPVKRHPLHAALRLGLGVSEVATHKAPRYPLWATGPALREFARLTAQAIEEHKPQAVLSISPQCLVYLDEFYGGAAPVPTFVVSDSAWMAWMEVYKGYYPLPLTAGRFAALERQTAKRVNGLIYASEWAREDAIARFGVSPEKVYAQPMGASWVPKQGDAEIAAFVDARPRGRVELLFVAKEWERKGGPLALEIARSLRNSGRVGDVRLNVVGVTPSLASEDRELVRVFGLLRRSDPFEAEQLRELFLNCHFLVVPTVAECFGLVFAEAQAFAIPPVSRAVDALPSVILDGQTGVLQAKEDGPEPYVQRLIALLEGDRSAYRQMAMAGRKHFQERLNWGAFGLGVRRIIEASL